MKRWRRELPHFAAKAKSVIWLFMEGGPSGVDLFDRKPKLDKSDGQRIEIDVFNGDPGPLMKSPFPFNQYGQCGAWVCDKYQNIARHVDEIAFVKSCFTESNDHVPALYQMVFGGDLFRPLKIEDRAALSARWGGTRRSSEAARL